MKRRALVPLALAISVSFAVACGHGASNQKASKLPCPTITSPAPTSRTTTGTCVATEPTHSGSGSYSGSYKFTFTQPLPEAGGTQIQTANLDIRLTANGNSVQGTVEGPTRQQLTQPACPSGTVADGRTTAQVKGTVTNDALELQVLSASWHQPQVQPCPSGGLPGIIGATIPSGIANFDESLSRLVRGSDGAYHLDRTETNSRGPYHPYTLEYHIVVRLGDA